MKKGYKLIFSLIIIPFQLYSQQYKIIDSSYYINGYLIHFDNVIDTSRYNCNNFLGVGYVVPTAKNSKFFEKLYLQAQFNKSGNITLKNKRAILRALHQLNTCKWYYTDQIIFPFDANILKKSSYLRRFQKMRKADSIQTNLLDNGFYKDGAIGLHIYIYKVEARGIYYLCDSFENYVSHQITSNDRHDGCKTIYVGSNTRFFGKYKKGLGGQDDFNFENFIPIELKVENCCGKISEKGYYW